MSTSLRSVARRMACTHRIRTLAVRCIACAVLAGTFAAPVHAQDDAMTAIAAPPQPGAIPLGPPDATDSQVAEAWHRQYGSVFVRNVDRATLTPFLPDPAKATGTAVIVAPGGGFRALSMQNEGWEVARALADRGVAAFVLKYRLQRTPDNLDGFAQSMQAMLAGPVPAHRADPPASMPQLAPQLADARAAFALVRSRARAWGVDPHRIGMVGFSAGAMLTLATTLAVEDADPAFVGMIYGPLAGVEVPADAPPLFVAIAADDGLFADGGFGLVEAWRTARRPVEFHFYEQGGHGFGMYAKPTTSTGWFEAFAAWMAMHGWLARMGQGAQPAGQENTP